MKRFLTLGLVLAALVCGSPAQLPAGKLTAKDIKVYRFSREFKDQKFAANDREMPDELRVTTSEKGFHLTGKKKQQQTVKVKGRLTGHIGKLVLVPTGERKGKLSIKVPPADDVTYYFASLEFADDSLDTRPVPLAVGKNYSWSVTSANGQTTFQIQDAGAEVASFNSPSSKVKGFGFAASVRNQGNEADLTVTFD